MHALTEGHGRNVRRRSEPAGTHYESGSGNTLRRQAAGSAADATTSHGHDLGRGTVPRDDNRGEAGAQQADTTQRLRNEPNGGLEQPRRQRKQLKVASLNMNGRGHRSVDKWGSISYVMKMRGIAVMALQETHPSDELQGEMEKRFRNTLDIAHSADPENPSTTGGVSIVLNKGMLDVKKATHRTVISGRVMLVEIPWNGDDTLRIMNIYAPVRNAEKAGFWEELLGKVESADDLRPDIVMGDFNLVENPEIDRLNNRGGAASAKPHFPFP